MAHNLNPSGFNRDRPRNEQTGSGSAGCETFKRDIASTYGASAPACMFCRNLENTEAEHYASVIVYANPTEHVICQPCAESIRDALV